MLLLLAQGTNHPLAVQVTFHYPPHTLTLERLAWCPPWWWQQSLMEWELERCLTQWLVSSSLQSTGPLDRVWLRLSGGSLHLSKSQIKISHPGASPPLPWWRQSPMWSCILASPLSSSSTGVCALLPPSLLGGLFQKPEGKPSQSFAPSTKPRRQKQSLRLR